MAATKAPVKEPAPLEAPADQPIPAQPAPRPKDAPRTMLELREARHGRKPSRAKTAENVLREGLRLERVPDPCVLVLFGATGDLAHRKVIPALYQLWRTNLLPHDFHIVCVGRRDYDDDSFRADRHNEAGHHTIRASHVREQGNEGDRCAAGKRARGSGPAREGRRLEAG